MIVRKWKLLLIVLYVFASSLLTSHLVKGGEEVNNEGGVLLQSKSAANCEDFKFSLSKTAAKPDFFLIGASKCGTTSFSQYLNVHPNIKERTIETKEPNFFSGFANVSRSYYQRLFSNVDPIGDKMVTDEKLSGDFSPSYLLHPLAPRRIRQQLPNAKIIYLLRNPIDRAYSHYIMRRRSTSSLTVEQRTFEEAIAYELEVIDELRIRFRECYNEISCNAKSCLPQMEVANVKSKAIMISSERDLFSYLEYSYLFRSIYDDQIERWLSTFDISKSLFFTSEELYDDPIKVMQITSDWLHLPYFNFSSSPMLKTTFGGGASKNYSPHSYEPINPDTRRLLASFFEPYNLRLYSILGRDLGWR